MYVVFFYYETSTTTSYTYRHTLSLHDALPIAASNSRPRIARRWASTWNRRWSVTARGSRRRPRAKRTAPASMRQGAGRMGTVPAGHHGPLAILPALPATDVPRVSQVQPSPVTPALAITAYTATTALRRGRDAHDSALPQRRGGLRRTDFGTGALGAPRRDPRSGPGARR